MINLKKVKTVQIFHDIMFFQGENNGYYKITNNNPAELLVRLLKDIENFNNFKKYAISMDISTYYFSTYFKNERGCKIFHDPKIVYNMLLNYCSELFYADFSKLNIPEKYKNRIKQDINFKYKNHIFKILAQIIRRNDKENALKHLKNYGFNSISEFKIKYLEFLHNNGINVNSNKIDFKIAA